MQFFPTRGTGPPGGSQDTSQRSQDDIREKRGKYIIVKTSTLRASEAPSHETNFSNCTSHPLRPQSTLKGHDMLLHFKGGTSQKGGGPMSKNVAFSITFTLTVCGSWLPFHLIALKKSRTRRQAATQSASLYLRVAAAWHLVMKGSMWKCVYFSLFFLDISIQWMWFMWVNVTSGRCQHVLIPERLHNRSIANESQNHIQCATSGEHQRCEMVTVCWGLGAETAWSG